MDWISEHAWSVWLGLAMLLGVAELFSLDLVLLMLAVGALTGLGLDVVGLPLPVQILGAAATSVAMLALVRPSAVRRLRSGPELRHGPAALIGTTGFALEEVSVREGLVKLGGEIWTARPYDEHVVIPKGAKVEVYEIKGATAFVAQVAELDS
ncbi:MAG TPA: NfeD family protein [Nocardioidaceae bacterium]|nr:NfeD family protein [Nocardioidaceae bacterium]